MATRYLPDDVHITGDSQWAAAQRARRERGQPAWTPQAWGEAAEERLLEQFVHVSGPMPDGITPRRLLLYHGACRDGFAAAWAVRRLLGSSMGPDGYKDVEYRAATHGAPPLTPDEVRGRHVLVVDFSWPREVMDGLAAAAASFACLDHHRSAEAALLGAPYALFDMERSGAGMAWDEVIHEMDTRYQAKEYRRPWLVDYVEDRDLWRFKLLESKEVNAYLSSLPFDFDAWDDAMCLDVQDVLPLGRAAQGVIDQYVRETAPHALWTSYFGHEIPVVNAPTMFVSELLDVLRKDVWFALAYFRRADGMWQYSLRSDGRADVSEIARGFGGGGHRAAAGFQLDHLLVLDLRPASAVRAVG